MSTKSSLNVFENVDKKTVFLICCFIRLIQISEQIIPTSIIQEIIKYYHLKLLIFYLKHSVEAPIIRIAQFESKQHNKCIIKPLDKSYGDTKHQMCTYNAICFVNDFKIPSKLLSFYHNTLHQTQSYDVIFSIQSKESICYIIDPINIGKNIDVNIYYWKLPGYEATSSFSGSFALYSAKHGVISIGESFNVLNFDEETNLNEWKWENNKISKGGGYGMRAVMITDNKLFCCGGSLQEKQSNVYDFNLKTWTSLANMNEGREWSGICFDQHTKRKVYVGGGEETPKKFEYYDIEKNKWISLSDTKGRHELFAMIWLENENIINIASTWSGRFEKMDVRENKWHSFIKNDENNKKFNNLFGIKYVEKKTEFNRLCL